MIPLWACKAVQAALAGQAAKAAQTLTATAGTLGATRQSLALTGPPVALTEAWAAGAVVQFAEGVWRTVSAFDTDTDTLTWQRPLLLSESVGATVTLSNPLADAACYFAGGNPEPLMVTVYPEQMTVTRTGLGTGYSTTAGQVSLGIGLRQQYLPTDLATLDADFSRFMAAVEQAVGLAESVRNEQAAVLVNGYSFALAQDPQDGSYTFGADVTAETTEILR